MTERFFSWPAGSTERRGWQASLGASAEKVVFIPEGKTAKANGCQFEGPVFVACRSTLGEVSFVALGADDNTEARLEATDPEYDSFDSSDESFDDQSSEDPQDDLDAEADCLIDASLNVQPILGNDAMLTMSCSHCSSMTSRHCRVLRI